ncbi:DHA2 family efflux MFS transporter permease subunit [Lonepinella koalarum]|uniref:EmrB/QacA subfamily drug resistance transporter n=1 Tax=Lonepinella koalarum TaxID=53417 RepID=A0A4R1KZU6_9PAST|nr:DHA2 family efflux MFS transporter permease subunit [Lonepinella koalarum]MDH2925974.1 MFS transporter [Lonepinella koalarum]TCK71125.1 EmrB/QacA subfamily drug resistance transporter [Lonepinella koalarum]TFJ90854.1 DHA2 family efflux MFS transporter permease subunit [Lonepinella koalarum]TYG34640.1 DHA2 family efflux MFS transporter permease subunit [Lonepinella koalarum]
MEKAVSPRSLAWIAATAFFMQALDTTILNTALPTIATDLHQSPLQMQLAVISYALTVALFIPISGWLADKYGTLNIFRFAVTMFVLGSVSCAFSMSLEMLIFSRILQGFGGAMMMPVARLAIIRTVPKNELLPIWNLMAMAGLTGPIIGPILGGWLVTYASWHWIFLINIPIGLVGILLSSFFMPNVKNQLSKFDWQGFLLFASGLVCVTLGLDLISETFVEKWQASSVLGVGCLFLLAYYFYAKGKSEVLIPLSLFQVRTYNLGSWSNLFIRLCGSGIPFLLPLMLQVSFQYSADYAGYMVTPIAISSLISKPFIRPLLKWLGYRKLLMINSLCMAVAVGLMCLLTINTPLWAYISLLFIYGMILSIMFTSVNTLTVSELDHHNASAGSTMLSVIQQVGIGLGIAVSAIALNFYRSFVAPEMLQQAFSYTFLTSSIFGVILFFIVAKLDKSDGENLH